MNHKIILDVDNAMGIPAQDTDDAMAIALALTQKKCDILAITTSPGNCRTRESAANTLRILELAGRTDIPVALGVEKAFIRDRLAHHHYLEEKTASSEADFWKNCLPKPKVTRKPHKTKAYELIINLVNKHPGKITLVMLSSMGNLALAILTAPEIIPKIKGVYHMGGAFESSDPEETLAWDAPDIPAEIWDEVLRFNSLYDPEATAVVLRSGIPFTTIPANVTVKVQQYKEDLLALAKKNSPAASFISSYGLPWVEWSRSHRRLDGAHMHDPLPLMALFKPELFTFRTMQADTPSLLREDVFWLHHGRPGHVVQAAVKIKAKEAERYLAEQLLLI